MNLKENECKTPKAELPDNNSSRLLNIVSKIKMDVIA
jgi:hypothetical protein